MADQFATVNGQRVVTASIGMPLYGLWEGDVLMPTPDTITNPVSLVFGNLTLLGAVYRQGAFAGSQYARLVGGYAGWRKTIQAQAYNNSSGLQLSLIMGDAAAAVGEQINIQQDTSIGNFFVRENAPAQRLLRQLCGPEWYVDVKGVTQVGPRPSGTIPSPFNVVTWNVATNEFDIATEDYASWLPNMSFTTSTVPTPQTVSFARFNVDNNGTFRLRVLGSP